MPVRLYQMRFLILLLCSASLAAAASAPLIEQSDHLSPNHLMAVHYERRGDMAKDSDVHLFAVLKKGQQKLWSLSEIGRHCYFSWSPDSRFLLVAWLNPGRAMDDLLVLDLSSKTPHATRHSFLPIIQAIDARVPEQHGHENTVPYDGNVNWESVRWLSSRKCQMQFQRAFFNNRGNALLQIDLQGQPPHLDIIQINSGAY